MRELDRFEHVGGTDAGRYLRVAPDVLLAVPRPGFAQTVSAAEKSLVEMDRLARLAGRKQAIIVLVDRVVSQDVGSRRVWSRPRPGETRCAQALVCGSPLARAVGSFFLGLNKGPITTRMFATLDEAIAWSSQRVESHGGPL
jgi:hypothetical protein